MCSDALEIYNKSRIIWTKLLNESAEQEGGAVPIVAFPLLCGDISTFPQAAALPATELDIGRADVILYSFTSHLHEGPLMRLALVLEVLPSPYPLFSPAGNRIVRVVAMNVRGALQTGHTPPHDLHKRELVCDYRHGSDIHVSCVLTNELGLSMKKGCLKRESLELIKKYNETHKLIFAD